MSVPRRIYNMQHTMRIKMTAMVGRKIGLAFQNNGYCSQLKTVQENLILWKVVKT